MTEPTTARSKVAVGANLRHLLAERKLELPEDPKLLGQLRNLRQEQRAGGYIDVRPNGGKDDSAVAVALAVSIALKQPRPLPFELVFPDLGPSPESLGQRPESCIKAAVCGNFPDCWDAGHCLGFKDTRPVTISNARICFT